LLLPTGISQGFVSVTLPYLLTQKGFSVELSAAIIAFGLSANIWRFLWGPVADIAFSLRTWYWIGLSTTVISLFVLCIIPYDIKQVSLLYAIVFVSQVAATLIMLPMGGIMAHRIEEHKKGRASGWFQAGNLGGTGIGGGIGLWLAMHYNLTITGIILCSFMLLCGLPILIINDVKSNQQLKFRSQIKTMSTDLITMFKIPVALFIIILIFLPIGTGAVSYLWSAVGTDWKVSADTIALTTGVVSGLISATGSIVGGYIADRLGIWCAYLGSGAACALVTIAMSLFPYHHAVYVTGVLMYAFTVGLAYSGFSATVLYAIGKKAASTKYALLSSFSNIPVVYMTMVDGWAHDYAGSKFMLLIEAFTALFFIAICLIVLKWMNTKELLLKPIDIS
jgi:MFS family permease